MITTRPRTLATLARLALAPPPSVATVAGVAVASALKVKSNHHKITARVSLAPKGKQPAKCHHHTGYYRDARFGVLGNRSPILGSEWHFTDVILNPTSKRHLKCAPLLWPANM